MRAHRQEQALKVVLPVLRPVEYVRASNLGYLCAREQCLYKHEQIRGRHTDLDSEVNFATGDGIHWALQNRILSSLIRGLWQCGECGHLYGTKAACFEAVGGRFYLAPKPEHCPQCKSEHITYKEQALRDPKHNVGGHSDGIMLAPWRAEPGVLEIKSSSPAQVALIREQPKDEHVIQVQLYLHLTGLKWGSILYVNKSVYTASRAWIEHSVERDDGLINVLLENVTLMRDAIAAWDGKNRSVLPERICADRLVPRAKECPARGPCFDDAPGAAGDF